MFVELSCDQLVCCALRLSCSVRFKRDDSDEPCLTFSSFTIMSTYASPLAQSAPLLSVLCFSFGYEPLARSVGAAYESYVEHVPLLLAAVLVGAAACDFSDVKVPKLVRVSALQAFILYGYEALAELVLMFTSPSMEQAFARFTAIVLACAFTISSGAAAVGAGSGQVVELGWISILARAMTTDEDE